MKHLQDPWKESSVQIAEAKAERDSHTAELERLQRAQSELREDISELEATIDQASRVRASRLRAGLRETASTFGNRSSYYTSLYSGDLFDAAKIKSDKEVITFYEKAQTEATKKALEQSYKQALRNQEERKRAGSLEPIDVGVILHTKGEQKLDVYLTALTNSTGGLANNFIRAVRAAVQASGVSFVDNNVDDLLRITVEGDYQGLVQELEKIRPEGFKEANVRYHAVVLGEAAKKTTNRSEKRARTALQLEEAVPVDKIPDNYMTFDKASEILGLAPQNCYNYVKSGHLVSKKYELPDKTKIRAVEIESLKELCRKRGKFFPDLAETAAEASGDMLQGHLGTI